MTNWCRRSPTEWHTVIAESNDTLQTVAGIGGRLYAVYSHENLRTATVEFGSPDDPVEGAYLAAYSPEPQHPAGRSLSGDCIRAGDE